MPAKTLTQPARELDVGSGCRAGGGEEIVSGGVVEIDFRPPASPNDGGSAEDSRTGGRAAASRIGSDVDAPRGTGASPQRHNLRDGLQIASAVGECERAAARLAEDEKALVSPDRAETVDGDPPIASRLDSEATKETNAELDVTSVPPFWTSMTPIPPRPTLSVPDASRVELGASTNTDPRPPANSPTIVWAERAEAPF